MNINKRDCNGWVICPSQRFPGKLYFFNIHSGEAVWSLNELERRTAKNDFMLKVKNWHMYPEPECSPVEEPQGFPLPCKKPSTCLRPSPVFGQAAFSKYPPNMGGNVTQPTSPMLDMHMGISSPNMPKYTHNMEGNIGQKSINMGNTAQNLSFSMGHNMTSNLPSDPIPPDRTMFSSNDNYGGWTSNVPMANDFRNFEENPYWSKVDGGRRFPRFENSRFGDSSNTNLMKSNYLQQQLDRRPVFGLKSNVSNLPDFDRQSFSQNVCRINRDREISNNKRPLFGANNEFILKRARTESESNTTSRNNFDRQENSDDDSEISFLSPQNRQNMFLSAEKYCGKSSANQSENYFRPESESNLNRFSRSMTSLNGIPKSSSTPQKQIYFSFGATNPTSALNLATPKKKIDDNSFRNVQITNKTPQKDATEPIFKDTTRVVQRKTPNARLFATDDQIYDSFAARTPKNSLNLEPFKDTQIIFQRKSPNARLFASDDQIHDSLAARTLNTNQNLDTQIIIQRKTPNARLFATDDQTYENFVGKAPKTTQNLESSKDTQIIFQRKTPNARLFATDDQIYDNLSADAPKTIQNLESSKDTQIIFQRKTPNARLFASDDQTYENFVGKASKPTGNLESSKDTQIIIQTKTPNARLFASDDQTYDNLSAKAPKTTQNLESSKDTQIIIQKKTPNARLFATDDQTFENLTAKAPTSTQNLPEPSKTFEDKQDKYGNSEIERERERKEGNPQNQRSESIMTSSSKSKADDPKDLRHFLLAKRRKVLNGEEHSRTESQSKTDEVPVKKIKTRYTEAFKRKESKKRVTFDLGVKDLTEDGADPEQEPAPEELTISTLRHLNGTPTSPWYIVVDTDTLLDEYRFVDRLVAADPTCTLLVPYSVKYEIDALCMGDCRGRLRVLTARQMARRLNAPPSHIMVEPAQEDKSTQGSHAIVECCWQAMEEGYHVVLITNNTELYEKAIESYIFCYTLQEIQDGVIPQPDVSFEPPEESFEPPEESFEPPEVSSELPEVSFERPEIENQKPNEKVQFILKVANDYKPSQSGHKDQIPVNCSRKRLFEISYDECEHSDFLWNANNNNFKQPNLEVSNNENELIVIRREIINLKLDSDEKMRNMNNIPETEIHFQNLTLNDKQKQSLIQKEIELRNEWRLAEKNKNESFHSNYDKQFYENNNSESYLEHEFENRTETVRSETENQNIVNENCQKLNQEEVAIKKEILEKNNEILNSESKNEDQAKETNQTAKRMLGINPYTIETHLKKFAIKYRVTEERVVTRMDELICCFRQIMENVLAKVLMNKSNRTKSSLPLTLQEAIDSVSEMCDGYKTVKLIADKLTSALSDHCCTRVKDKIKPTIPANDFMRIFGCGVLLIKYLKVILPENPELSEAEINLERVLSSVEQPTEHDFQLTQTPVVIREDLDLEPPRRRNFIKSDSFVEEYLLQHFGPRDDQLQHATNNDKRDDPRNRANGKNLNISKLSSSSCKNIILYKQTDKANKKFHMKLSDDAEVASKENVTKENATNKVGTKETDKKEISTKETGAKLIKKLAFESLNQPPKMKEIDIEKREKTNKEMFKMVDCIVTGKPIITKYYDIDSIIVDKNAAQKIVQDNEKDMPMRSPVLPSPRVTIKLGKRNNKIDNEVQLDRKVVQTSLVDSSNSKTKQGSEYSNRNIVKKARASKNLSTVLREKPNKKQKDAKNLKLIDIFDESNQNQIEGHVKMSENGKSYDITETLDLDILDYSEMEASIAEESERRLQIDENDARFSDSIENTSRSNSLARKEVTSTSNDVDIHRGITSHNGNNGSSTSNNELSPTSNEESANVNVSTSNGKIPTSNANIPTSNVNISTSNVKIPKVNVKIPTLNVIIPTTVGKVISRGTEADSTQGDEQSMKLDNESMQTYIIMTTFLTQVNVAFNAIYEFILSTSRDLYARGVSSDKKTAVCDKIDRTSSLLAIIIDQFNRIIERESSDRSPLKEIQLKISKQCFNVKRITRYKHLVGKCADQAAILQRCLRTVRGCLATI